MTKKELDTIDAKAPPLAEAIEDRPMLGVCPSCGHNWKTTLRRLRLTRRCARCRYRFSEVRVMAAKAEGVERDRRLQERIDRSPTVYLPGSATGARLDASRKKLS